MKVVNYSQIVCFLVFYYIFWYNFDIFFFDTMQLLQQLKKIGLTQNEARVYMYLLENGISSPPQIAKGTGISRTNCYHLLRRLMEEQLVSEQKNNKRKLYVAKDPQALYKHVDKRREHIEHVLPDLRALYTTHKNKPQIHFYEGFEQVKQVYYAVAEAEEVHAIGSTKHLYEKEYGKLYKELIDILNSHDIVLHDIISHDSGDFVGPHTKDVLKGFYEYKMIPKEFAYGPTDIVIWNDKIAMINLTDPIFATTIQNAMLADTFRVLFTVMWKYLPTP